MTLRHGLISLLMLASIVFIRQAPLAAEPARCCVPISMEVTAAIGRDGAPILNVVLKNDGSTPLSIGPVQNPWAGPSMVKVVGMHLPDGAPIANVRRAVADPSPVSESLAPGQSLQDVIDLDDMYPELAAEIRKGRNDVMVFWTYQLRGTPESQRLGGWVLFAAKRR